MYFCINQGLKVDEEKKSLSPDPCSPVEMETFQ